MPEPKIARGNAHKETKPRALVRTAGTVKKTIVKATMLLGCLGEKVQQLSSWQLLQVSWWCVVLQSLGPKNRLTHDSQHRKSHLITVCAKAPKWPFDCKFSTLNLSLCSLCFLNSFFAARAFLVLEGCASSKVLGLVAWAVVDPIFYAFAYLAGAGSEKSDFHTETTWQSFSCFLQNTKLELQAYWSVTMKLLWFWGEFLWKSDCSQLQV